jgi:hypothetical protein
MNREKAKELLPVITHFAKGGNLWTYTETAGWVVQSEICLHGLYSNIIEDEFFEERKHYALGGDIEVKHVGAKEYKRDLTPFWCIKNKYRIAVKPPVREYQFLYQRTENSLFETTAYLTFKEVVAMKYYSWETITGTERIRGSKK